jgi:AcrR family transcriptional regulator
MAVQTGLRERKKLQTRQRIFDVAQSLFVEKGFERVSVAEVARAADVSEVTVFNYFPSKEDLFFGGMQLYEEQLVEAVRDRAKGESAVKVFRRMLLAGADRLGLKQTAADIRAAGRIISASPSLIAREREMVDRYVVRLAELLAEESGAAPDDVEPLAAASALMGAQRALVAHVRRRVLAGWQGKRLADDYRIQARRALSRMERGLAGYAVKA